MPFRSFISKERLSEIVENFTRSSPLVVVGDVGIDKYTQGEVHRISPEAPVPVIKVTKEWPKLGLGANVSDNLKSLGIKSTLCGIIGTDKNAKILEKMMKEQGLNREGLVYTSTRSTILKERVITESQQICRIDYESTHPVHKETTKKFLKKVESFLEDHQAVIIQDYNKGTFQKGTIPQVISLGKKAGRMVNVDPHYQTPPENYQGASLLKPNLVECKAMARHLGYYENDLDKISEILVDKLNLEKLVITLGSEGMAWLDTKKNGKLNRLPTVGSEVFDVSGAGDTVISLLTLSLLAGANLEEAAWIGNCGAGVVVRKKGTAVVSLEELKDFHEGFIRCLPV